MAELTSAQRLAAVAVAERCRTVHSVALGRRGRGFESSRPRRFEREVQAFGNRSFQEAFALAEAEAAEYARGCHCTFIRATDTYHLFEESIGHGSEIWSVMRGSGMEPELYAETFCATPRDRAGVLDEDSPTH